MKHNHLYKTWVLWAFRMCCFLMLIRAAAAADSTLPQVLQDGFTLWPKGGAEIALDTWQKGGLLDGDNTKSATLNTYFKSIDRTLGNFRSAEWVDGKSVAKKAQIIYLAINFERGVVFGKFVLYQAGANWVVQDMVFNTHPEAIMPWLATEGSKTTE